MRVRQIDRHSQDNMPPSDISNVRKGGEALHEVIESGVSPSISLNEEQETDVSVVETESSLEMSSVSGNEDHAETPVTDVSTHDNVNWVETPKTRHSTQDLSRVRRRLFDHSDSDSYISD